ncbi:MAG TPA: tetratricopeptide repeat protein [Candidatus Hydrogenedens sp.]|nr:tetratricopeptide repeat protein [Candidatus Hydrogenedens sp.]
MKMVFNLLDNCIYNNNFQTVINKKPPEEKLRMFTTKHFHYRVVKFLLLFVSILLIMSSGARAQTESNASEEVSAVAPLEVQDATSAENIDSGQNPSAEENAETYFRRGVGLYKKELYREALTEFNRALALNPNHQEAQVYQQKCNAQLQLSIGEKPEATAPPAFETFQPAVPTEVPEKTADELKKERVQKLLSDAQRYMEAQKFDIAVEIYNNILLIDPKNAIAREGLHQATIKLHQQSVKESERKVAEDRAKIRDFIEKQKQLPEGADARGIKPYKFTVPEIEEEVAPVTKVSEIEKSLDSVVSIEFEDIHISEITQFISDSYGVNIVIDNRAVEPPAKQQAQQATGQPAQPGALGMPGGPPGAPAFGGAPGGLRPPGGAAPTTGGVGLRPGPGGFQGGGIGTTPYGTPGTPGVGLAQADVYYGTKSDGIVPYISLKDVTLREALKALLRPLGLDFSVQPGFVWISKPEIIRQETFEPLETRFYELRNVGADILFKLVLRNPFGGVGGGGGYGGGMGGMYGGGMYGGRGMYGGGMGGMYGGGMYGGGMGGMYGGGMYGGGMGGMYGGGGYGGGYRGGVGGYGGGMYGGGMGGMYGGGMGGMYGGGMYGGYRGGMGGYGGGMYGGMGGYGRDVTTLSNISDMFSSISDQVVGELGPVGIVQAGTGATAGLGGRGALATGTTTTGYGGAAGTAQLGARAGFEESQMSGLQILADAIPSIKEPYTGEVLSKIAYNEATNMLIVTNTPTNLDKFEQVLGQIDVTPKQVSIEAKFLTVRVSDLKKIGFNWSGDLSDQNNRPRQNEYLSQQTYSYDINGDGVDEEVPFYVRPDGSQVIRNSVTQGTISGLVDPALSAANPTFSIMTKIIDNADGDKLSVSFDYLNSLSESELLSAPRVTTMNRKPAVVADFQTEYYLTQVYNEVWTTEGGFGGTPTQSVITQPTFSPFNFGIALSVTPQIRDNDQIRLWLNPEVRARIGEKRFEQKNIVGTNETVTEIVLPTTSWQAAWTNVIVHDGDTLVLGGLVQDKTIHNNQKMPYLADIPLIGFFFRGKSKEVSQSSLLIFVTPDIIDTTGARFFSVGKEAS